MHHRLSAESVKSLPHAYEEPKTASRLSDDTKKNTDHTTVTDSFCGCRRDKCDAFFDKLLCYLEKQSDILSKCCAHKDLHRESGQKRPTPCKDDPRPSQQSKDGGRESRSRHPNQIPTKDEPRRQTSRDNFKERKRSVSPAAKTHRNSECQTSAKCPTVRRSAESLKDRRARDDEDCNSEIVRYKSQQEGNRMKLKDKPCNIYIEVCSCQKPGKKTDQKCPKPVEDERCVSKLAITQQPTKSNEYGFDCQGCEKKVCCFFQLAEEICQGYMKQNMEPKQIKPRDEFGGQYPSRSYGTVDESYMRPGNASVYEYNPKPIAIEIECGGAKEEYLLDPCLCVERYPEYAGASPAPSRMDSRCVKKSCLETFEERYGKILRELHAKMYPDQYQNPPNYPPAQGYPLQPYPPQYPQQYPPQPTYPNQYGDTMQQPPPQQSRSQTSKPSKSPDRDGKSESDSEDKKKKKKKKKNSKKEEKKMKKSKTSS